MTEKRKGLVALLNALGVRELDADASYKFALQLDRLIEQAIKDSAHVRSASESHPGWAYEPVQVRYFGDTVVFFWPLKSDLSEVVNLDHELRAPLHGLLETMALLGQFMHASFNEGVRFRGAVAFGEFVWDSSRVIGPAVAEAAACECYGDWLGVMTVPNLTARLAAGLTSHYDFARLRAPLAAYTVRYESVPSKTGGSVPAWVSAWPL